MAVLGRSPLTEVALVYGGVTIATFILTRLRVVPWAAEYVHLAVGGLFLVVALKLAQREIDGLRRYGIDLAGVLAPPDDDDEGPAGPLGLLELARTIGRALPAAARETGFALGVAALVFPPFSVGFWLWYRPDHPFVWNPPDDLGSFALAQLLVVGLPEEALFRGYFQTRLGDAWPRKVRLLGAEVSLPALAVQALLFGLLHFAVDLDPRRLAVCFPGLLFGWLRAYRGGIGASVVLHALSNVYSDLLIRGWL